MLDIVGKRGWYFLISALIIVPGLISMIIAPGWITGDSGLRAGIDFSSGSVMNVTFRQAVDRMNPPMWANSRVMGIILNTASTTTA